MGTRGIASLLAGCVSLAIALSFTAARSSATPSTTVAGTYVAYFTGKERSSHGHRSHAVSPGAWTLVLKAGKADFYDPRHPDPPDTIHDTLRISGSRLVFGRRAKCADRRLPATVGIYTVAKDGKTLRFTKVKDSCNDRAAVLTAYSWKRLS
jgi:hypothetical protein